MLSRTSVWLSGGVNSKTGPGPPKSAEATVAMGFSAVTVWMPKSPL